MKPRKGLNLPETKVSLPCITPKDAEDLAFALTKDVDWVGLSFVRRATDIKELKDQIDKAGKHAKVVAKIEKPEAVSEIDDIIASTDAVMVARGDLGVEMPMQEVPLLQKDIVRKCMAAGRPVIVATQMLDSMMRQPRPTRAEVTDVAAAVLDGADAVMLSGETAAGKYPIESLQAMKSIIREADAIIDGKSREGETSGKSYARSAQKSANVVPLQDVELDAVARAACRAADALDAKLITCVDGVPRLNHDLHATDAAPARRRRALDSLDGVVVRPHRLDAVDASTASARRHATAAPWTWPSESLRVSRASRGRVATVSFPHRRVRAGRGSTPIGCVQRPGPAQTSDETRRRRHEGGGFGVRQSIGGPNEARAAEPGGV